MNLNKGCIEIFLLFVCELYILPMNLNKGCIEICSVSSWTRIIIMMNLNKGCIEMLNKTYLEYRFDLDEP